MGYTSCDVFNGEENNEGGFYTKPDTAGYRMKGWHSFQYCDNGRDNDERGRKDMHKKCSLRGGGLFEEDIKLAFPCRVD